MRIGLEEASYVGTLLTVLASAEVDEGAEGLAKRDTRWRTSGNGGCLIRGRAIGNEGCLT